MLRISDSICSPVIAAEHKLRANASFIIIGAIKIVSVNFKRKDCEQNHDHIFIYICRVVQMQLQTNSCGNTILEIGQFLNHVSTLE